MISIRTLMIRVSIGLVLALALLVLVECSFRGIVTAREDFRTPPPEWFRYSAELGWELQRNFKGIWPAEIGQSYREFDAEGFFAEDTLQVANHRDPKILVLGDSCTFGYGEPPKASYPELLDALLPDASVINLGVNGYSSFQGYKALLKYAPRLNPAIIIVSFNYNDRLYVLSEKDIDTDFKFEHAARLRAVEGIQKLYLYRVFRIVMVKLGLLSASHVADNSSVEDVRKLRPRVSPADYRTNLARMAEYAKERHIPFMFLLLGDNPVYVQHLRNGITHLEQAQYGQAIDELKIAVNLRNEFSPLARKYLALAYDKAGMPEEAKKIVRLERVKYSWTGGYSLYLDTEYHSIMRDVAKDYNVPVIDAASRLRESPSTYVDMIHIDAKGNEKIAALLHDAAKEMLSHAMNEKSLPVHKTASRVP